MEDETQLGQRPAGRRSFLKGSLLAGGALVTAGLLGTEKSARAQSDNGNGNADITDGDAAILRFLAAAELIEADLWTQYAELGGITSGAVNSYQTALQNLDGDGSQYITSNTLDEVSHAAFLNAYLESKGVEPVDLDAFRTLQGSKATGAQNIGRLTNLMHLNVDTSWYIRYRSTTNPDLGATYPQAITIIDRPAIPRTNADLNNATQIQVIANTAAFHFGTIEQGGSSLYASLSRKVTSEQVLEITLGIGGDEITHFLEWVDFAGNGVQPPVAPVSFAGLTFPDFTKKGPLFQPNLIFPIPCEFLNAKLPKCAIIRPLTDRVGGARAAAAFLTNMNLFEGQSKQFFTALNRLADAADAAKRDS
ncbi:MAG TPA: ferritin-like domain-containing protein [Acidobacteriaceae bacterium]|nr:ferritin-like domain-containing protein [Acidobacteriaceae bacterium]